MSTGSPESLQISQEARDRFQKKYRLGRDTDQHKTELAVRKFVGDSLKDRSEDPRVVLAAVQFGQLAFDLETGRGKRDYIILKAQRSAEKLRLSPEEIELTKEKAAGLYAQFKMLAGSFSDAQAPNEVFGCLADAQEAAKKLEDEARQKQAADKRGRLRLGLERRFQKLMSISDEELRIQLCNERINLKDNPVYCDADAAVRETIRTRTLRRSKYGEKLREVRRTGHVLTVNLNGIDQQEFFGYAISTLNNGRYLGHDVPDDLVKEFSWIFMRLLTSGQISRAYVEKQGIKPDILQSRARSLLTRYRMQKIEEEYIKNPSSAQMRVKTRRGKDPHIFLGDGSHRLR